jgi:hypothetical protein
MGGKPRVRARHKVTIVAGVAGPSVYLNDYRIAGPKPWGGGRVVAEYRADGDDVDRAMAGKETP